MFFKKKKKITTAKAEIIDLGEIKPCNDNLTEVRIDVPENCQEFFSRKRQEDYHQHNADYRRYG